MLATSGPALNRQPPRVWVLLGKGTGGNNQMRTLADALGWPYELKQLRHNKLNALPTLLLGASDITLDKDGSSPLVPPWPDVVIAASRRAAPVALWIKKQSGGRTQLVHLLHAQAPLHWFDLVLTLPQYRLPHRDNVVHLAGALNRIDRARIDAAAEKWRPRLQRLARPWTALLVGGSSSSYELDTARAAELGRAASARARASAGSLLVTTSPRTPPDAAAALAQAIDAPSFVYLWKPDDADNNPYHGFLALADDFIVTVDSASLLVEAAGTGRPVAVFEWPRRGGAGPRGLQRWVGSAIYDELIYWGALKPPRDFDAYHREMKRRGLAYRLGDAPPPRRQPLDDIERAVQSISRLLDFPAGTVQTSSSAPSTAAGTGALLPS
ncbi:MAG TPA: ELM1/GtrOC1 family putative glycosyltransferase [Candidatus Limnocylindrales bacterium]|nr:ELM1/GtrOC1 family putative glycosyltransferase [Candidatus Limnocylindrales bacterium]